MSGTPRLVRREGVYYFRMAIPERWVQKLQRCFSAIALQCSCWPMDLKPISHLADRIAAINNLRHSVPFEFVRKPILL